MKYLELESDLTKTEYPNLMAEHYVKWCNSALARGANVSEEIMMDVLKGKDDLTKWEKRALAKYIFCKEEYLFSPKLSVLNREKTRHKMWIKRLEKDLDLIWRYEKRGSERARKFINSSTRVEIVNLGFWMRGDSSYQEVTYALYRKVREEVDACIYGIAEEECRPRTKRIRQSANA